MTMAIFAIRHYRRHLCFTNTLCLLSNFIIYKIDVYMNTKTTVSFICIDDMSQIHRVHKNQQLHPLALDLNKIKIPFSRISFQHGDPN